MALHVVDAANEGRALQLRGEQHQLAAAAQGFHLSHP
jgi:hypothetical protein